MVLALLSVVLAACGGEPAVPAATTAPTASAAAGASQAPVGRHAATASQAPQETSTTAEAATSTAAGTPSITCAEGSKAFVHAAGESCVPQQAQRIVTTQDQNALLPLLELGVKPVGSAGLELERGGFQFRRTADFDTSGIAFVGSYGEPNLELIAKLQPDLIVGSPFQQDIYDKLSAIAPTVLIDVHDRPLDQALRDFADLVNAGDRAATFEAEFQERIAALRAALGARYEQLTVSVITPGDTATQFYNEAASQATGTVMQALAVRRPAPEQGPEPERAYRSIEQLPEHDADAMLIISYAGESDDLVVDDFMASPIFNNLRVAQAKQVYVVDGLSVVGAGWTKMNRFVEELERIVLAPAFRVDVVDE